MLSSYMIFLPFQGAREANSAESAQYFNLGYPNTHMKRLVAIPSEGCVPFYNSCSSSAHSEPLALKAHNTLTLDNVQC